MQAHKLTEKHVEDLRRQVETLERWGTVPTALEKKRRELERAERIIRVFGYQQTLDIGPPEPEQLALF